MPGECDQSARGQGHPQAAGRIREHEHGSAERGRCSYRSLHQLERPTFINVVAPHLDKNSPSLESTGDPPAGMASHAGIRKPGQLGESDTDGIRDGIGQSA